MLIPKYCLNEISDVFVKELIRQMLHKDPAQRPTLKGYFQHWINNRYFSCQFQVFKNWFLFLRLNQSPIIIYGFYKEKWFLLRTIIIIMCNIDLTLLKEIQNSPFFWEEKQKIEHVKFILRGPKSEAIEAKVILFDSFITWFEM